MKTLIAIPCMDMVPTSFLKSLLSLEKGENCDVSLCVSSLIYDARNQLAHNAVAQGYDRILWLDSDMVFEPDLAKRLHEDLDKGHDMVCALYFRRREPISPVIYNAMYVTKEENGRLTPHADQYLDYPEDSIFEIAACGFGGVMMTTELVKKVAEKYGLPFSPINGFGEDLSFCIKAHEVGANMACDSSIKVGHEARFVITEETYKKGK